MVGWPIFSDAKPSLPHLMLSFLEKNGIVKHIITQNVDRLHTKGGSTNLVELHGTLFETICLGYNAIRDREGFQNELESLNSGWVRKTRLSDSNLRADGDTEMSLSDTIYTNFSLPKCTCGFTTAMYKPNVVLFGENCAPSVKNDTFDIVRKSDGILVIGSSCTVYSVYRLLVEAEKQGTPIAILNIGETRADQMAQLKIQQPAGLTLQHVVNLLTGK
eukprot:TRINITY_DN10850_c0_g1_i1.p1 TRINITY_DN10850_c0_g1~~TRINITY_DN10850_c0_g1_i1.p1  ORF type:complete len:218 (-),score=35.09 TRINITY_DN10850_c0_g1_i1:9-662(-)